MARIYVEITRGTPLLVQIYFYWYIFGQQLSRDFRFLAGALILSLFSGAYISEIIRAGIESIGQSQLESARAIGFTRGADLSPRHLPAGHPADSPAVRRPVRVDHQGLVAALRARHRGVRAGRGPVSSFTSRYFESYLPVALGYLILTLPISLWTQSLEKRARSKHEGGISTQRREERKESRNSELRQSVPFPALCDLLRSLRSDRVSRCT